MSTDSAKKVFPLPLEAFERYMLADDLPEHPMVLVRQLLIGGELQCAAFESAVEVACGRHPLLRALVDAPGTRRACWVDAGAVRPRIDWNTGAAELQSRAEEYLDPAVELGLRVWVRSGTHGSIVTLQFHHACVDGTGAMQFIADLLAAYGEHTCNGDDPRPGFAPLDPELLRRRGDFSLLRRERRDRRVSFKRKLDKLGRFFGRRATPLAFPADRGERADLAPQFPGLESHTFSVDETARLRDIAKAADATVNDLLLRDLFTAIHAWNREQLPDGAGRWVRIAMPVNLRSDKHVQLPAANVVSYGFLSRDHAECQHPERLLRDVSFETGEIKGGSVPTLFLKALRGLDRIPGALRRVTLRNSKKCTATVVLSNVGDISPLLGRSMPVRDGRAVAGDVVLEAVRGCPPLMPLTRAVFHVMTYAGEMTISTRAWPEGFGRADARALLRRFVGELRRSLGDAPGTAPAEQPSWEERVARAETVSPSP